MKQSIHARGSRHSRPASPVRVGQDLIGAVAGRAPGGAHRAVVPASFRGRAALQPATGRHAPRTGRSDGAMTSFAVVAACSAGLLIAAQWSGVVGGVPIPGLLGGDSAAAAPAAPGLRAAGGSQNRTTTVQPALAVHNLLLPAAVAAHTASAHAALPTVAHGSSRASLVRGPKHSTATGRHGAVRWY